MDFTLDDDLLAIQEMARDFAQNELAPHAERWDEEGSLDLAKVKQMGELGMLGMLIPEEYGGTGLGNLALSVVLEELNAACASSGVTASVHCSLATGPLVKWGSEHIKKTYLPRMATGEWIGAYALSETGSGSDAAGLQCRAVDAGDHFVLNGTKMWVTTGDQADVIIVFTRTDPSAGKPSRGITAFVIEATFPGFSIGKVEKKLGIRASHTCELIFDNCKVSRENVLGEVDKGFPIAMDTLDGGRIGIASQSLGITRACLEASVKYANERHQFGKPLSRFQAIQHKITEIATRLDGDRLLTHRAAWLKDRDLPHGKEAAMAKLSASRTANFAGFEAIQIHGGVGFTREFPVERYYRDARITEIYEGTTEILNMVIARAVLSGIAH